MCGSGFVGVWLCVCARVNGCIGQGTSRGRDNVKKGADDGKNRGDK